MNRDQNCPHCDKKLNSKLEVDYHIAENHQHILLTSKSCHVKLKNYCQYQKHMDTKLNATSHPFTCELCGKIYWTENHLNLHRRQEHFETLGMIPFSCKLCGKIL
ncbi:unnamed protein product [Orchesella dallaii]|uniref:C2H2-type domain-containing protein n=1 Tax=Orchesella dallaii TaxID=48710 RepID=A0ABP1PIV7_9HEXA